MKLKINGIEKSFDVEPLSIKELLTANRVQSPDMVSVQLNGTFIKNEVYEKTYLTESDEVDFLYFMGGGSNIAFENPECTFSEHWNEVIELASSVIELYNNMDDSLQFKTGQKVAQEVKETPALEATKEKDLRGVGCPMNFVKVKIELAQMKS